MKRTLIELAHARLYWLGLLLTGAALEGAALYYQYARDEWPCLLCIQVRIWVVTFMLLAVAGLFLAGSRVAARILHGATTLVMLALLERSWRVLAVERGWVFGDCEMDLGLPAWFALDKWFPWIFEVQTACGYTPFVLFRITLAEALLAISIGLALISATLFAASWFKAEKA